MPPDRTFAADPPAVIRRELRLMDFALILGIASAALLLAYLLCALLFPERFQ